MFLVCLILLAFLTFASNLRYLALLESRIVTQDDNLLFFTRPGKTLKGRNMAKLKISENEAAALLVQKARPVVSLPADDQQDSHKVSQKADGHKLAGLSCALYGGPSDGLAAEMIYWRDIPKDATYESPFAKHGPNPKYVTFEPDEGGWNNIRMAMGTFMSFCNLKYRPC